MDYSAYRELKIRRLEPGVLEIVMGEEGGKLPVATARMHAELARIWLDVDLDRDVRVAILRGAGKGFEGARKLGAGAQTALRWTKYSLNNWLRMAGPTFDASLALEVLGFTGPEAKEGVASHREKRKPSFPDPD